MKNIEFEVQSKPKVNWSRFSEEIRNIPHTGSQNVMDVCSHFLFDSIPENLGNDGIKEGIKQSSIKCTKDTEY